MLCLTNTFIKIKSIFTCDVIFNFALNYLGEKSEREREKQQHGTHGASLLEGGTHDSTHE